MQVTLTDPHVVCQRIASGDIGLRPLAHHGLHARDLTGRRAGVEHPTDKQTTRLNRHLETGDPTWEVTIAWRAYQELRRMHHASSPATGRRLAEKVVDAFPTCPIPEITRLERTLRAWREQVLAYFPTGGVSNGDTEAINLIIETRRLASSSRPRTYGD